MKPLLSLSLCLLLFEYSDGSCTQLDSINSQCSRCKRDNTASTPFRDINREIIETAGRSQEPTSTCPSDWLSWTTYCYRFVSNSSVTWDSARDECRMHQAHLLRIETSSEYDFVKKNLATFPSPSYWTDLNARPQYQTDPNVRTFLWGNDEFTDDSVVKNHWDLEPDNTDFEDCVTVSIQGTLSIGDCNERHPYICQLTKNTPGEACPNGVGWYDIGAQNLCLFVANATDWSVTKTWNEARRTCETLVQGRAVQLLAISTPDVQTFLVQSLPGIAFVRQVYWIGLNDIDTEGTFVWAGNAGAPYDSTVIAWREEPNNLAGQEYCGALLPGGVWSDRNCDDQMNYICRRTLPDANEQWNMGCGAWTRAGQKCVFIYSNPKLSWQDARDFCRTSKGDLMRFDSLDDMNWMAMQAATGVMTLPGYWIGLNDIQEENSFVWTNGDMPPGNLLNWDVEPNEIAKNSNQDCATMGIDSTFLDNACSGDKAGAICEEISGVCMLGWVLNNGHCYMFDKNYRTHNEAQRNCQQTSSNGNGRLVVISTPEEKTWLVQQISSLTGAPYYYWVDLQDNGVEGNWYWLHSDGENPVSLDKVVKWNREPNNWAGDEDCVQMDTAGLLNDLKCSNQAGFVCQRSIGGGVQVKAPAWLLMLCLTSLLLFVC